MSLPVSVAMNCEKTSRTCMSSGTPSRTSRCHSFSTSGGGFLRPPPSGSFSLLSLTCLPSILTYQNCVCVRQKGLLMVHRGVGAFLVHRAATSARIYCILGRKRLKVNNPMWELHDSAETLQKSAA